MARLSNKQVKRLSSSLRAESAYTVDVLSQLAEWRLEYIPTLCNALNEANKHKCENESCSGRLKNASTIIDKIRRSTRGASPLNLDYITDIAGVRLVLARDSTEQRRFELRDRLQRRFRSWSDVKDVEVHDADAEGYRAIHLRIKAGRYRCEVQIRTYLQHRWAECYERLADVFGRGIRYGEKPEHQVRGQTRCDDLLDYMMKLSTSIQESEFEGGEMMGVLEEQFIPVEEQVFGEILPSVKRVAPRQAEWLVIRFDRHKGVVDDTRSFSTIGELTDFWVAAEKESGPNERYERVILAGGLDLQTTHSRYFSRRGA